MKHPDAAWALTVAALWAREHQAVTETDEYLDALVALAAGEIAPRRAWGPLRQVAKFLIDDAAVEEAERLPSYWQMASVLQVPEGWQARIGEGSTITTVGVWQTRELAEKACLAFRPRATVRMRELDYVNTRL